MTGQQAAAVAGETGEVSFTFDWYASLLDALTAADRRFRDYRADLSAGDVVLRHDVDWSPRHALETARIEADRGVTATYFFLVSSPFYNVYHRPNRRILSEIQSLGHDVGLHFSTRQYWETEPPESALVERLRAERTALRTVAPDAVDAVSFHRPPEWVLAREFDAFPSAYEPRFFESVAYRADSRQRWRDEHPFDGGVPETLQVLTHPGLWAETDAGYEERLAGHLDRELGQVRAFMEDQYVEKQYTVAEFWDRD